MKITIKNVKHSAFASQETHCFEATVYIDGKRSFKAFNEGHGGGNSYYGFNADNKYYFDTSKIDDELATKKIPTDYGELDNSLEIVIGDLVNDWLDLREMKKDLKCLCFVVGDEVWRNKSISSADFKEYPQIVTRNVLKRYPTAIILNSLPIEEAKYIWLKCA